MPPPMVMPPLIDIRHVCKTYRSGAGADAPEVQALRDVNLQIGAGQFVAIMGASGSGKSTLMNIMGALDQPSSGTYFLDGERVDSMSSDQLAGIRNRRMGFIFQQFNLLTRTNALENVELPLIYAGVPPAMRRSRALYALAQVGLESRWHHTPTELSGGQQQRVAIARALVNRPQLILADEPTGALDSKTSHEVMHLLCEQNSRGITVILVTHEADVAAYARRCLVFRDGQLVDDRAQAGVMSAGMSA